MMLHTSRFRLLSVPPRWRCSLFRCRPIKCEVKSEVRPISDGERALDIIVQLLEFPPRWMETVGHQRTIDYFASELKKTKFSAVERGAGSTIPPAGRWQ